MELDLALIRLTYRLVQATETENQIYGPLRDAARNTITSISSSFNPKEII